MASLAATSIGRDVRMSHSRWAIRRGNLKTKITQQSWQQLSRPHCGGDAGINVDSPVSDDSNEWLN